MGMWRDWHVMNLLSDLLDYHETWSPVGGLVDCYCTIWCSPSWPVLFNSLLLVTVARLMVTQFLPQGPFHYSKLTTVATLGMSKMQWLLLRYVFWHSVTVWVKVFWAWRLACLQWFLSRYDIVPFISVFITVEWLRVLTERGLPYICLMKSSRAVHGLRIDYLLVAGNGSRAICHHTTKLQIMMAVPSTSEQNSIVDIGRWCFE
jgi:hypothetical protein